MRVKLHGCGPAANQSEIKAFNSLKTGLISLPGDGEWVLLTNLTFSVTDQLQSDEIDVVAIGPPGVRVIEVKHWTDAHRRFAERTADLLTMKARKIGTTLRRIVPNLPHVGGSVLLTRPPSKAPRLLGQGRVRGVRFYSLKDWREAVGADARALLSSQQVAALARKLAPRNPAVVGTPRRLASYVNLEPQSPWEGGGTFHRVYKGEHSVSRDRVLLHLYDYSAGEGGDLERTARREHDALRRLQLYPWAPRILDSFQGVPGYRGEMGFFTIVDPAAPSIAKRDNDDSWSVPQRLAFARSAVRVVAQLHEAADDGQRMLHRNLSPLTILVMHDNSPVLTGFENARLPSDISLGLMPALDGQWSAIVAPEVSKGGLSAADERSDVYSLCASLRTLFSDPGGDRQANVTARALAQGTKDTPDIRPSLSELERNLTQLLGEQVTVPVAPPSRYWTEGQVVGFRDRRYRIVARLGSGGAGTAFKVVELDPATEEELGTFVGKVAHDEGVGERARRCHQLVRDPVSRQSSLSSVFEVATEWRDNEFTTLLTWIEGAALADFAGVVPLLAEQYQTDAQELATRWLRAMCQALGTLHRNGVIHGDVTPRNMIVSGDDLVLIDYDCVARIEKPRRSVGTVMYASPPDWRDGQAAPADDLHALAASFFHVLFDKEPFLRDGHGFRKGTLAWGVGDRDEYPALTEFFDRAVLSTGCERLTSVQDALDALARSVSDAKQVVEGPPRGTGISAPESQERYPNEVPWLRRLLESYPGSRWGNRETRGLDTGFATSTYVETDLEETLFEDILERKVQLVVLCGNAGDGKTALLQRLADALGMGRHDSSKRVIDEVIEGDLRVRMNLDGSAAWEGRSADHVLDEFLEPFRDGPSDEDIVHLLAVNDGRLLEWIGRAPRDTPLKSSLERCLDATMEDHVGGDGTTQDRHIAFQHLNQQSHVGSLLRDGQRIGTTFVERLLDRLYGGEKALKTWEPCFTCSAQESCEVFRATRVFGSGDLPGAWPEPVRERARERLFKALQAVHFRGETHITVRELRSALVYVLFGTRYCTEYHQGTAASEPPYWDRAFAASSPRRQGEVLKQLVHMDPALEAHPKIDRKLLRDLPLASGENPADQLASARRRAYFEWTAEQIGDVVGGEEGGHALELAQGRHLPRFRDIPLMDREERRRLCAELCKGIARLGDLPLLALDRSESGFVPLRITPRTPTETAFWSEKSLGQFRLVSESDNVAESPLGGAPERLPRTAYLAYRYENEREERLRLTAGLFHRLLQLGDGFQLADISTDDTFANLSIFLRRLVQEDDRDLMAWNPIRDDAIYRVCAKMTKEASGPKQTLLIQPTSLEGGSS